MALSETPLKVPKAEKEGKTVLIIERDPFYRSYMENFFRRARIEQEFVTEGITALKRIKTRKPDLLITEAILPKVDGLAICKHVRSEKGIADIPIIIFSVLEIEEEALEAGADAFVLKPFKESDFAGAVSRFLPVEAASNE